MLKILSRHPDFRLSKLFHPCPNGQDLWGPITLTCTLLVSVFYSCINCRTAEFVENEYRHTYHIWIVSDYSPARPPPPSLPQVRKLNGTTNSTWLHLEYSWPSLPLCTLAFKHLWFAGMSRSTCSLMITQWRLETLPDMANVHWTSVLMANIS